MALFKSRATVQPPEPEGLGFTDESVEVLRQRARRRLMGSAALIVLAIIGFPLVFDHEPRPVAPMDVRVEIPNRDQTPSSAPIKATPASAAAPAEAVPDKATAETAAPPPPDPPAAENEAPKAEVPKAEVPKVPESKAKSAAAANAKPDPVPAAEAKESASSDRFVIQIGAFAEADKVKELRTKLDRAGLKSYIQNVKTAEGSRTRVRLGPFTSEDEARKVLERVKALNLQAQLLKL